MGQDCLDIHKCFLPTVFFFFFLAIKSKTNNKNSGIFHKITEIMLEKVYTYNIYKTCICEYFSVKIEYR